MLHLKPRLHAERRALLDRKWVLIQVIQRARLGELDNDVRAAFDFQTQREDDAFAWVFGVGDGGTGADAQGFFPFAKRFVVLVYSGGGGVSGGMWRSRVGI